ncbi:hypothetical protein G6F42_020450 [Rhizopus arrhizus]|nr:hypothetical protein G6F42_020450 [Rhizopus arrhizus]
MISHVTLVKTPWFGLRGFLFINPTSAGSTPNAMAGGISAMMLAYKIIITVNGVSKFAIAQISMRNISAPLQLKR